MRRSPSRKTPLVVSLFPFLAVLICTMGAMIVLLVLVVQQARVHADTISEQRAEDRAQQQQQQGARQLQLRQEEEDFQWQQQILQQQRRELTEQLGDRRLQLSHLEDHIRRLEQRWRQLEAEAAEASRSREPRQEELAAARQQLDRLRAEIEAKRAELIAARDALKRRKPAYSIVPYDGPHGTRRRPIYIECRETAIIIQPENVVLVPDDFAGPLGPGNPLDAVLRAIREHWTRVEGGTSRGEPYPLLIVRPDGAVAYSMARAAMAAWEDEFGYELVDSDMNLSFPPSDPQLKQHLEATIAAARQRQALLAAAMPSRFSGPRAEGFRLTDRDMGIDLDGAEGYGPRGGAATRRTPGSGLAGSGAAGSPGHSDGGGGRVASNTASGNHPIGGPGLAAAAPGNAPGFYQSAPPWQHPPSGGAAGGGFEQAGAAPGGGAPSGTAGPAGGAPSGAAPAGGQGGTSPTAGSAGGASAQASTAAGAQSSSGEAALKSIAQQKGANWALPNVAARSTGITRPIAVECYPDRLVILPDRGDSTQPQIVPMDGPTQRSVQQFVSAVWTHMERWGMAVAGGYWKPVVKIRVAPGAENRFDELRVLLQDSGIEVEKR